MFLIVYPIQVQISSGTNRFGFNSVRVISSSDLHRVNKSSDQFGFNSGHVGFRVNSGHYSFGSVQFWVDSISDFGSKSIQLFLMLVRVWFRVVLFGSFGSGHFCQVYLWVGLDVRLAGWILTWKLGQLASRVWLESWVD